MSEVRVEWQGAVACVIVDRPQARNALAPETMQALAAVVRDLATRTDLRALVLAGGGGRFIAGGDLIALEAVQTTEQARDMATTMQGVLDGLEALPVPVIAAIDRFALGGGAEVALAADLRVASADVQIAFKHGDFAVSSAWGAARRLARLVGHSRALELLWSGRALDAKNALAIGLVNRVACGESAYDAALDWAAELAGRAPMPVAAAKNLLVDAAPLAKVEHRALEAELFAETWTSDAHWARVEAWKARRTPTRGRFIVFEGLDGAGTTTQARLLVRWLRASGRKALVTAEPSTGPVGVKLRAALGGDLLGRDGERLTPQTIALMFAADRADHLKTEIEPALARGIDVVCDRYVMSSLAYQGAEGQVEWVAGLNAPMLAPDLTLLLRVDPSVAAQRRNARGGPEELYDADPFQRRVAAGYDAAPAWRPNDRLAVIDGSLSVEDVHQACLDAVLNNCPLA